MNRHAKIAQLKAIASGKVKALDGKTLAWDQKEGVYYCENPEYIHLKLTEKQFNAFCEKYGGHHIVFGDFSGRDEPIQDDDSKLFVKVNMTVWDEQKDYGNESQTNAPVEQIQPISAPTPTNPTPEPEPRAKRPKKAKINPEPPKVIDKRAKEKAALQKCLDQMEKDKARAENMNSFKTLSLDNFL